LTRFAADQDNLLAAMSWAIDTADVDLALRLLCNHPPPSAQPGFSFRVPGEPVIALPGAAEHPDYPVGLAIAASYAAFRGDLQAAERWCEQAIAAERHLGAHPDGLVDLIVANVGGAIAMSVGAWHEAAACYQRAAEFAGTARDEGTAMPLISAALRDGRRLRGRRTSRH